MAAAESWELHPQTVETLAEQMARWSEGMATMSEGAPGYASLARYEDYVAELRGQLLDGAPLGAPGNRATSFADSRCAEDSNEAASGRAEGSPIFKASIGRMLNYLGLR